VGPGFDHVEIGRGRILLLGGAPGVGKTALAMQWVFDVLAGHRDLRVVVANVEMSPSSLLDRQLARLSDVPLTRIRERRFEPCDRTKLAASFDRFSGMLDRLAFVNEPHRLVRILEAADDHGSDLIVLDYVQRIDPPDRFNGIREKTNALMSIMRKMADTGVGILAVAALSRSRDDNGRSSYAGKHLGLASFRESSELEYGCDDAFLLYPTGDDAQPDDAVALMTLNHLKSRHRETKDAQLAFYPRIQAFKLAAAKTKTAKALSPTTDRAKALWAKSGDNGVKEGNPIG
jgi:replicative DNA helicase